MFYLCCLAPSGFVYILFLAFDYILACGCCGGGLALAHAKVW